MVKVLLKLLLLITWKPTPECFFNEKFCTSTYICRLHSKEERHFSAFRRKIINDYLKRAFIKIWCLHYANWVKNDTRKFYFLLNLRERKRQTTGTYTHGRPAYSPSKSGLKGNPTLGQYFWPLAPYAAPQMITHRGVHVCTHLTTHSLAGCSVPLQGMEQTQQ